MDLEHTTYFECLSISVYETHIFDAIISAEARLMIVLVVVLKTLVYSMYFTLPLPLHYTNKMPYGINSCFCPKIIMSSIFFSYSYTICLFFPCFLNRSVK